MITTEMTELPLPNRETVLKFIHRFLAIDQFGDVRKTFTSGCCYWFAAILRERFGGHIVYDPVNNHFACVLPCGVFDITGEITDEFAGHYWLEYKFIDPVHAERITRQCINFEEENV